MPLIKPAGSESPILNYLERLHGKYADLLEGKIADYIPELAKADRNWFAICLATIDGQVYEVGNSRQLFTIQSISKPFVYGLALEDHGEPTALQKVGVEPTGDAFNSISLDPQTGRPLNPMINAGAIAVAGLVRGSTPDEKRARVLQAFSCYAGRELTIDDVVYQSEKSTGHRNRAIGHMLRNFDILSDDPEPVLDLYFQQCSIAVHCRDLAVMAASLANGGVNPLTGQRAVQQENVARMLSIMVSCGMYDYAGEWMYRVGMPAKSGVSGGILAVLPGQLGIGVFSPPLDAQGNSVRGIRVCHEISRSFHLHLFHAPQVTRSVIRACYDATKIRSRRLRNAEESQVLQTRGDRIKIYELQGELTFATVEIVVRDMLQQAETMDFVIVDMKRVVAVNEAAYSLFVELARNAAAKGLEFILINVDTNMPFYRYGRDLDEAETPPPYMIRDDNDSALEWCENRLLAQPQLCGKTAISVPLVEHQMSQGLTAPELHRLQQRLRPMSFSAGEFIIHSGDLPDHIYLLMKGEVSVTVGVGKDKVKRLSTLSAGMVFGEMAIVDHLPRSADVRADTDVECYALSCAEFDELIDSDPKVRAILLQNILQHVTQMLRRSNMGDQRVGAMRTTALERLFYWRGTAPSGVS